MRRWLHLPEPIAAEAARRLPGATENNAATMSAKGRAAIRRAQKARWAKRQGSQQEIIYFNRHQSQGRWDGSFGMILPSGLLDWRVRRLIINADDFGLTSGVNRAIVEAHDRGGVFSDLDGQRPGFCRSYRSGASPAPAWV